MSKQRPSLGGDPLDTVLGDWSAAPRRPGPVVATPSPRRVRATFHLPHALVEEARNATVALSGPPTRLTLARLVEDADPRQSVLLTRRRVRGAESLMPVALRPQAPTLRPAAAVLPAPPEIDEPPIVRPLVQTLLGRSDRTRTS